MIKTAAEASEGCAHQCPGIIRRKWQSKESHRVNHQAQGQELLAAQSICQRSKWIAWQKISDTQDSDQQGRLLDTAQPQILLNAEIKGKQGDLVKMGEGMESAYEPKCALFMTVVPGHKFCPMIRLDGHP